MSDKATLLREAGEAFTELHGAIDGLTDEEMRRVWLGTINKRALPARGDVERRGARWKPYRTVASWYLWRVAERAGTRSDQRRTT